MLDRESGLRRMNFKVLLREDIWKDLRFENKSHFYGRSVRLEWRSQFDYAKTALKQALRSRAFATVVDSVVVLRSEIADWPDETVLRVWNLLVGERMKGGNAAFTRNWVWNRLADGNGDHGPRALLQLLREATEWERGEHQRSPFERSVIRPRALIDSMDAVSGEALDALLEEFAELQQLTSQLRTIGRSPVEAETLNDFTEELALAQEVGLLSVYEETEGEVRRYRVPDLYRIALGMTRRGQA